MLWPGAHFLVFCPGSLIWGQGRGRSAHFLGSWMLGLCRALTSVAWGGGGRRLAGIPAGCLVVQRTAGGVCGALVVTSGSAYGGPRNPASWQLLPALHLEK